MVCVRSVNTLVAMAEVVKQGKAATGKPEGKAIKKEDKTEPEKKSGKPITDKIRAYASVLAFCKYFGGGFLVWSFGRWAFNYYWLLSGIFSYTLWKCYMKDKKGGKDKAPVIVDANDTCRMSDLPHWVSRNSN